MPALPLPENASIEDLRGQADLVHDLVRSGDEGALDMVVEFHPRVDDRAAVPSPFERADAHLVVARLYGFPTWVDLREHLSLLDDLARPDIADLEPADDADRFVGLGCVTYGEYDVQGRIDRADEMLRLAPELADATSASMATAGNHRGLASLLEADPGLATAPCGPNRWPPILYCAYSRVGAAAQARPDAQSGAQAGARPDALSTLEAARLLLEAGADPNAGFLWRGLVPRSPPSPERSGTGSRTSPATPRRWPWPGCCSRPAPTRTTVRPSTTMGWPGPPTMTPPTWSSSSTTGSGPRSVAPGTSGSVLA